MGNIIGEIFDDGVRSQINTRQNKIGSLNKTQDNIKWQNNTNAFLRLASSVNISGSAYEILQGDGIQVEGLDFDQSGLASHFVLYNGSTPIQWGQNNVEPKDPQNMLQSGINYEKNNFYKGAYGFGGLEMGYKPMPGLVSANVSFYNRGSLKTAEVQIKAFTPKQFEIIEVLYMRVGFTLLLEWGHNQYWDNDTQKLITAPLFSSEPLSLLFNGTNKDYEGASIETMLKAIKEERKERSYNYDAIYGKIKNFNWTFNKDGTYDITINIISVGDVIESLNVNKNFPVSVELNMDENEIFYKPDPNTNQSVRADSEALSENETWKSALHKYIWNVHQSLENKPQIYNNKMEVSTIDTNIDNVLFTNALVKIGWPSMPTGPSPIEKPTDLPPSLYYIKLGRLLQFIEKNLLYYYKNGESSIVGIDYDPNNYCLAYQQQFSSDPRVCLIPIRYENKEGEIDWNYLVEFGGQSILGDDFFVEENPYVGSLMNIHINTEYILSTFTSLLGDQSQGKVNLYDFLQNLMDGVSNSLGGVNRFSVTYNNENNKIVIREDNNLRYDTILSKNPITEFNLYGFQTPLDENGKIKKDLNGNDLPPNGSIIEDINFNVQITNQFATMVSIGSQANANPIGENATLISNLYKGTTDRVVEEKLDISFYQPNNNENTLPYQKIPLKKLNKLLDNTYNINNKKGITLIPEDINTLSSISKNYAQYATGWLSNEGQIPPLGFFPFDLQLTLQGISGIKVYEKFKITENILPSMYRDEKGNSKMDFIIKGVNHSIQNNKWISTLETLMIPTIPTTPIISQRKKGLPPTTILKCPVPVDNKIVFAPISNTELEKRKKSALEAYRRLFGGAYENEYVFPITFEPIKENGRYIKPRIFYDQEKVNKISGECYGLCARYAYNFAQLFIENLKKGKESMNGLYADYGGGDAKQTGFQSKLIALGYTSHVMGKGISTQQLKNYVKKTQAGDIVVYWGRSGRDDLSPNIYGHAQFNIGTETSPSLIESTNNSNRGKPSPGKFASSLKNNYYVEGANNGDFIYGSYPDVKCWDLIIFKPPTVEEVVKGKTQLEKFADYLGGVRDLTKEEVEYFQRDNFTNDPYKDYRGRENTLYLPKSAFDKSAFSDIKGVEFIGKKGQLLEKGLFELIGFNNEVWDDLLFVIVDYNDYTKKLRQNKILDKFEIGKFGGGASSTNLFKLR